MYNKIAIVGAPGTGKFRRNKYRESFNTKK